MSASIYDPATKTLVPFAGTSISMMSELSDVELSAPSNGQVLMYDSTSQAWENADNVSDVSVTPVLSSGTKIATVTVDGSSTDLYAPSGGGGGGASSVSDLTDVELDNVQNGQVLKWNSTDEVWENANESGGGGGTSDYTDLTNKPSIESVTLSGNKTAADLGLAKSTDIPTKVSDLQNDSGFITSVSASDVGLGNVVNTGDSATPVSGGTTKFTTGGAYTLKQDIDKAYKSDDTSFTAIADGDYVPMYDISESKKSKSTWSNIKSVLKTYFDTLYSTVSSRGTPTSGGTTLSVVNTGDMYNWNTDTVIYCTCSTAAATTQKSVTVSRGTFTLTAGAKVCVKFTYTNTADTPTLKVGSSTAKNIKYIGTDGTVETPNVWWGAGDVVTFIYDGTQFLMQPTYAMPSMPVLGTIDRPMIFDTTEKVVGKWTDGRPLYQKTINFGALPNNTSKDVAHSISNLHQVWNIKGTTINTSGSVTTIPYADGTYFVNVSVTSTNLTCKSNFNATSNTTTYITLQYTKTTDAANSYNYADENDYSTSEKIIGTWIDGSKLYQKTINCGSMPNNTTKAINPNITNLSNYIELKGYIYNASNTKENYPLPYISKESIDNVGLATATSGNIVISTWADWTGYSAYVVAKYTKTTD